MAVARHRTPSRGPTRPKRLWTSSSAGWWTAHTPRWTVWPTPPSPTCRRFSVNWRRWERRWTRTPTRGASACASRYGTTRWARWPPRWRGGGWSRGSCADAHEHVDAGFHARRASRARVLPGHAQGHLARAPGPRQRPGGTAVPGAAAGGHGAVADSPAGDRAGRAGHHGVALAVGPGHRHIGLGRVALDGGLSAGARGAPVALGLGGPARAAAASRAGSARHAPTPDLPLAAGARGIPAPGPRRRSHGASPP